MSTSIPVTYPDSQGGYIAPADYSVMDNIQWAQEVGMVSDGYMWFFEQVRPGGPWDYKRQDDGTGNKYEGLGNWNYGAVGYALGIPEWVLLRLPGYWQEGRKPEWGKPWLEPPYGDDPLDQEQIKRGIEWAKENITPLPEHFPDSPTPSEFFNKMFEEWFLSWSLPLSNWLNDLFLHARTWIRRDPLAIDLDGDGIETVGVSSAMAPSSPTPGASVRTSTA